MSMTRRPRPGAASRPPARDGEGGPEAVQPHAASCAGAGLSAPAAVGQGTSSPPPAEAEQDTQPSRPQAAAGAASVVITCYNHGRWLGAAIGSALGQTRAPLEVIVVDDGSTDDTAAICRRHPGVRYLHQPNAGLSAARNTGLAAARGEYVAFLDADDLLLPEALERGVSALDAHPDWAFVYGGHLGVEADRTALWEQRPKAEEACFAGLLRANVIGMHATVLYRRAALASEGGFDTGLRASEDYDVYLRLARRHPIGCHDGVIAEYRQHGENMSQQAGRMLASSLAVLRAREADAADPGARAALAEGIAFYRRSYGPPLVKAAIRDLARPGRRAEGLAGLRLAGRLAPGAFLPAAADGAAGVARRAERRLPDALRRIVRQGLGRPAPAPRPGGVRWGDLRRTAPIDPDFGYARGTPVDRAYIEAFLEREAEAIRGRVLEVGDNAYTLRFGAGRVERSDVLHVSPDAPGATIVGDLADAGHIPDAAFDCIVLTQTLHLVFDMAGAMATLRRILRPGGVLLLTVPGLSQVDRGEWGDTWYWSMTAAAVRRLLAEGWSEVSVETHGNVASAVAFLHGLSAAELTRAELDAVDPAYQVVVAARAARAREDGT